MCLFVLCKINYRVDIAGMIEKISLTSSMRSNLRSLQTTQGLMDLTQQRLSTGNKVNSAIDNPSSYYTARSLDNRASDLSALLDSMGQAVQTVKAANEGIESATGMLEQMQSVAEQALTNPVISGATADDDEEDVPTSRPIEDFIAEGYTAVTSAMSADEIDALLQTPGAKLVLAEDVVLDHGLTITSSGITIDGNGHKLSYTALSAG